MILPHHYNTGRNHKTSISFRILGEREAEIFENNGNKQKLSMLIFWVVTLCGLEGREVTIQTTIADTFIDVRT